MFNFLKCKKYTNIEIVDISTETITVKVLEPKVKDDIVILQKGDQLRLGVG